MTAPLIRELTYHEYFRAQLLERFPEADEETLKDTLEGLTDLREMLAAVIRSRQEDRTLAMALKLRVEEMQERLSRFEHKVEKKRDLVAHVMERAHIEKVIEPDFTASLRQVPQPLIISDEPAISEEFSKPQPAKLDRRKLIDCLRSGQQIAGAHLGNGGRTVSVRVK